MADTARELISDPSNPTWTAVYRYAYRLAENPKDAEDLVGHAREKLVKEVEKGRKVDKPKAWLRTTVRNKFISDGRSKPKLKPLEVEKGDARTDDAPSPEDALLSDECVELVGDLHDRGVLGDLGAAILQGYREGVSQGEVASRCELNITTFYDRRSKLFARLRRVLGGVW